MISRLFSLSRRQVSPAGGVAGMVDPEMPPSRDGPWEVYADWVQDTDKFNEWANEEDHEVEDEDSASGKRKRRRLFLKSRK